jgi:hypothetical protein
MRFTSAAKLELANGGTVYVNPDHVMCVRAMVPKG